MNEDPLANLRDIHLPPAPELFPPAPGWWVLALIAVAALVVLVAWAYRFWARNRYRREARRDLARLETAWRKDGDDFAYLANVQALLKRVALTRYKRIDVASLTGERWVSFLDHTAQTHEFSMGAGQLLIDGHYRPVPTAFSADELTSLHAVADHWIARHGDPA